MADSQKPVIVPPDDELSGQLLFNVEPTSSRSALTDRAGHPTRSAAPIGLDSVRQGSRNSSMRVWRLPLRCLDRRRLLGQHSELHMCMTVMRKWAEGKPSGWSNGPQGAVFRGRRSALADYHDNLILPELLRRGYDSGDPELHASPVLTDIPPPEQGFSFWELISWDNVLLDTRHLVEKIHSDNLVVDLCEQLGIEKHRATRPAGYDLDLTMKVMHLAAARVHHPGTADPQTDPNVRSTVTRLLHQRLLEVPTAEVVKKSKGGGATARAEAKRKLEK